MAWALITGAAKRLGAVTALTFARAGYDVLVHYNHSQDDAEARVREIVQLGRKARALPCDLAEPAQIDRLFETLSREGILPSVLVNSASIFEYDTLDTLSAESLQRHYAANTQAPLLLAQHLAGALAEGEEGCIVNLLDQRLFNLNVDFVSYTLSKYALLGATKVMAMALAPRIRVNAIAVGLTLQSGAQSAAAFEAAHRLTPLGRGTRAQDVADAVLFLSQNRSVTGTVLTVDAGQSLDARRRDVMFSYQEGARVGDVETHE